MIDEKLTERISILYLELLINSTFPEKYCQYSKMVYAVKDMADFKSQLESAGDKLVVVDFFATW